jgi:uridine kinase
MIGLAGPSCSGKSTLAHHLANLLPGPTTVLSLDAYYRDLAQLPLAQRHHFNFDHPDALDYDLLLHNLEGLARGQTVKKPVYLFPEHVRAPQGEQIQAGAYLIIEGLFALYWEAIRSLLHTRIYSAADDSICLQRRLQRDTRERGRTPASVLAQYEQSVRPMYQQHLGPTREFADLVVNGEAPVEQSAATILAHIDQSRSVKKNKRTDR